MFPTVRGTCDNPGYQELFLGEVDDIIAAAEFLKSQDNVNPNQIYLGGHSTGGTLALLVAESTDLFCGVFSFGPAAEAESYGTLTFDVNNPQEWYLRSPIHFLDEITTPTFVIEGEFGRSQDLQELADASLNPDLHFIEIPNADHFAPLAKVNRFLAHKIQTTETEPFHASIIEILHAYEDYPRSQQEAEDLRRLAALRANGIEFRTQQRFHFSLTSQALDNLITLRTPLAEQGFAVSEIASTHHGDHYHHVLTASKTLVPAKVSDVLDASWTIAQHCEAASDIAYAGWQVTALTNP